MKKLILILLSALTIVGCKVTEEKARKYAYDHKDKLAEWCADCFPVKTIEIIKGDTIYKLDTITRVDNNIITVDCPDGTVLKCPPNKTIYKTLHSHSTDTIKVRDTAKEYHLNSELSKEQKEHEKTKEKLTEITESRNKYRKYFFISLGIIVAFVGLKLLLKFKII